MRPLIRRIALTLTLAMGALSAGAQSYPERPNRFIVAYPAGGGADLVARAVGQKLGEAWGQQVIVDNRPGGGANIGAELVPRAIVDKLNAEVNRVLALPELRERLGADGAELVGGTPAEFDAFLRREIGKWAKVIKFTGMRVE